MFRLAVRGMKDGFLSEATVLRENTSKTLRDRKNLGSEQLGVSQKKTQKNTTITGLFWTARAVPWSPELLVQNAKNQTIATLAWVSRFPMALSYDVWHITSPVNYGSKSEEVIGKQGFYPHWFSTRVVK